MRSNGVGHRPADPVPTSQAGMTSSATLEAAIEVRGANPADMPAAGHLGSLLMALHHDLDARRFIASTHRTDRDYAAFLTGELDRPGAIVLVAVQETRVLGYAYGGVEGTDYMALRGPAGVVYDLMVDPSRRGEGIGRRLLDAILAKFAALNVAQIVLSTAARNDAAQGFFAKVGFRPTMVEMTRETDPMTAGPLPTVG